MAAAVARIGTWVGALGLAVGLVGGLAACPGVDPVIDREGSTLNGVAAAPDAGPVEVAPVVDPEAPGAEKIVPPVAAEDAPAPSPRTERVPSIERLVAATTQWFEGRAGGRIYVQVDKPLYKPGETIWIKTWDLGVRELGGRTAGVMRYELVSPKGAVVLEKRVKLTSGTATNDLELPEGVQGGEYLVRAIAPDGLIEERPIIVSTYEAPRLKKKLELLKKAYGAGDEVTASIEVKRPTGEPLAGQVLSANVWLDGASLPPVKVALNAEGGGIVRFRLPERIERGDGLLTVMVDDGGVTESVSKRIPIILKKLQLSFFPEGGHMVAGLPARVYFDAKNTLGKPADVEGKIVDDHGNAVATFASHHAGLGRVDFTPATGRTYSAEITRPVGISERYSLPLAQEEGCVLRSYDDLDGRLPELRVSVRCSDAKRVFVAAVQREVLLDAAGVDVRAGEPAVVHLVPKDGQARREGVARVTVFDERLEPIAERIVYRNRRSGLRVELTPDKASYVPRERVTLAVRTVDAQGRPVPAELALSVVDDTVLSFADDKTGHIASRLLLEPELPEKVEEPNFFFDLTKSKSALAMDLLMGTRGYRRFEWRPVLAPPPPPRPPSTAMPESAPMELDKGEAEVAGLDAVPADRPRGPPRVAPQPRPDARVPQKPQVKAEAAREPAAPVAQRAEARDVGAAKKDAPRRRAMADELMADELAEAPMAGARARRPAREAARIDEDWAGAEEKAKVAERQQAVVIAPVRVFPAPSYRGDETGPRTDFRETIHWEPRVATDGDGRATVSFFLSDAVTSFRAIGEGIGGGAVGRAEKVVKSSLPFNLSVKLPVEVSAGDHMLLPLTLANERAVPVDVKLTSTFGDLLALEKGVERVEAGAAILASTEDLATTLGAGERRSIYYPVRVEGTRGKSKIAISAEAGGLSDQFVRELDVVPVGFPQVFSASGTLKDRWSTKVDLGASIAGSITSEVKLYPSPVASMISGLDGMLREPGGCFEQTSSTNYPNIMVMTYLRANDVADPSLVERSSQLLDRGYKRLVGFETPNKGYEWFGQAPGHERRSGSPRAATARVATSATRRRSTASALRSPRSPTRTSRTASPRRG
ncbi:hypothetical protein L6R52_29800 [Myxococcota bacterium]|nr:hypothetical protein [Myxococcota bacterium]